MRCEEQGKHSLDDALMLGMLLFLVISKQRYDQKFESRAYIELHSAVVKLLVHLQRPPLCNPVDGGDKIRKRGEKNNTHSTGST